MDFHRILLPWLLMVPVTLVEGNWIWRSAQNLCGGIMEPCSDASSCTRTAIGPCKGGATIVPKSFITSEVVGAATVNIDKYLNCSDPYECDDMGVIEFTGLGYRDRNDMAPAGTNWSKMTKACRPITVSNTTSL